MTGPWVWLDRVNELLVRARLGGRRSVPVRADSAGSLVGRGEISVPSLEPRLAPGRWARREERWRDPARGWHGRRWLPRRAAPGQPVVVLLHPWMATPLHLWLYRWLTAPLRRAGVELWVPTLPEHMERAEAGRASGEQCVSADLTRTAASIRGGAAETVALVRWLRERGAARVSLWGVSLGGWIGALVATMTDDLDAVVLWEPVARPEVTLRESGLTAELRHALDSAAVGEDLLAALLRELSPAERPLLVDRARVLMVAGRQDTVVPAATVRCLGARWGVATVWLEHAHVSLVGSPTARRLSTTFLLQRTVEPHA